MRQLLFVLVSSLLCCSPALAFESELVPLELNHIYAKESTSLLLHKEPSNNSPLTGKIELKKGEEIFFDQSRTRTIKSGEVKVKKNISIEGKSFGNIYYLSLKKYYSALPPGEIKLEKFRFKKGDTVEELHHGPEGSCIAKWQNKILWLEFCLWYMNNKDFDYISQPTDEWWIRVTKDNKPLGWLLIDEKTPVELT